MDPCVIIIIIFTRSSISTVIIQVVALFLYVSAKNNDFHQVTWSLLFIWKRLILFLFLIAALIAVCSTSSQWRIYLQLCFMAAVILNLCHRLGGNYMRICNIMDWYQVESIRKFFYLIYVAAGKKQQ